ncbi:MAG: acyl-CoA dehydrogenase [Alphaproteobacteria bacterium]|nr:acyl-CoA dehydrogenase [Alphaproteobacteria bacterium]MCB9695301.1 acyl-CoA dehydrogenase [Alphaproteobacteria bacterium]
MTTTDLMPTRDLRFLLEEVHGLGDLLTADRYAHTDLDTLRSVLDLARDVAHDVFLPLAPKLDAEEPTLADGRVTVPEGTKTAVGAFVEAGFQATSFSLEDGGMQLPAMITEAVLAFFSAASAPVVSYPALAMAAAGMLRAHGSEELRQRYLAPMIEGRWFGTMALSEPQAGSSLADLTTAARPADDGTYRLVGNKMWITAADHDLTENIVHFVLARIEGAPAGTRGISLFLVPKILPDGTHNDVRVVGLNHKLGYRPAANTVFAIGDQGGAVGWLVGEPHQGLRCMFHMMNEARIAVGLSASAMGWAGYRHSLRYARERLQGRPLTSKDPTSPQVPLTEHADVRRLLLSQKALAEGGLALALWAARLVDEGRVAADRGDDATAGQLAMLLDVVTPIVKGWCSHYGVAANDEAIQVHGGYGYTRDYAVERIWRDNRLNPIHEGTNGIQAMDLLGRKVGAGQGAAAMLLMARLQDGIARGRAAGPVASALAGELAVAVERLATTTTTLLLGAPKDPAAFLANATPYLHLAGHTVVAWLWLEQVLAAEPGAEGDAFLRGKLAAARYFYRWELPRTAHWASLLAPIDRTPLDTDPDDL